MTRKALVVGISTYTHRSRLNLETFSNNAEAIAQKLQHNCNFEVTRLPAIKGNESEPIIVGKQTPVTRIDLEQAIKDLFLPQGNFPPTTALLYFAGHGERKTEGFPGGYLVTSDADFEQNWGLSLAELRKLLQASNITEQLIWLDSCYSSELLNLKEAEPGEGNNCSRCFIAAATNLAYADNQSNYGIFTQALLEGLNPANYPSGEINNLSLTDFVIKEIKKSKFPQTPVFSNLGLEIQLIDASPSNNASPTNDLTNLPTEIPTICPYQGLEYFKEENHAYFFGRTELTSQLLDRVDQSNFLAILGASGSGKSSLLRAGLLYELKQGQRLSGSESWQYYLMQPGEKPLQTLQKLASVFVDSHLSTIERATEIKKAEAQISQDAHGLRKLAQADGAKRFILLIDQFEEVFTLCQNKSEREQFFQSLLEAIAVTDSKLCVILAMRADFFGKCVEAEYSGLARKIQANLVAVTPMATQELELAINEPAKKVKLAIKPELITEIIKDVQNAPGSLPLMQDTLRELWRNDVGQEQKNCLRLETYIKLGRVTGTLQQRATKVYEKFSLEQKEIARHIFLSLTQLGEGTEDTRRRVLKQDLVTSRYSNRLTQVDEVIQTLADRKLIVTRNQATTNNELSQESVVDVAHEALIRNWDKLQKWLDENRDYLRQKRKLKSAAQDWLQSDKKSDYLLRGARLAEAEGYFYDPAQLQMLNQVTEEFLQASRNEQLRLEQEAEQRRQQELADLEARRKLEEIAKIEAEKAKEAEEKARIQAEKAQKEAEKNSREKSQANKKLLLLSSAAIVFGLTAGFFGIKFQEDAKIAKLKQQAADVRVKLSLGNEVENLIEAIQIVGKNQQSNQGLLPLTRWFQPQINLIPEVHASLNTAVESVRERQIFLGHQDSINSIALSPDGQYLVSGSRDKIVRLWSVQSKTLIHTFIGHKDSVNSVAFSPDGQYLVSGSWDKTVKLWSVKSKTLIHTFNGHEGFVNSVAFSPDSQYIVSGSGSKGNIVLVGSFENNTVRLWSVKSKTLIYTFNGHQNSVNSVAFSPNGQYLVSGSGDTVLQVGGKDCTVRLWSVKSKTLIHTFNGHQNSVNSVAFSPNGQYLVSGSGRVGLLKDRVRDSTVRLWSVKSKTLLHTFNGHEGSVNSVAFSPDGQYIVSGSKNIPLRRINDETVKLWSVKSKTLLHTFNGHEGSVTSVVFSPDSQYLVSGSWDDTVRLWSVKSKTLLHTFNRHKDSVTSVAFSLDGQYLLSGSEDDTVKLWLLKSKTLIHTFNRHKDSVTSVAFSPNGQYIVSGSADKTIRLWSVKSKTLIHTFNRHKDSVTSVAFSPNGQYIVSGSADKTIRLWSVKSKTLIHTFNGHQNSVNSVAFSPDSSYLISGSADKTIRLWSVKSKTLIHTFNRHKDSVTSVAFSPDSSYLISGSSDKTVRLWSVKSKTLIHTFNGHESSVNSVDSSPDGQYIVSDSWDKTIRLWSVKNKTLIHTFNGHQNSVNSVAFSPDSSYLISGSLDKTIRLWSVKSKTLIHTFNGHESSVNSVAFSPDGQYIVSGSADKTVRLWLGINWQDWLGVGCNRIKSHPVFVSTQTNTMEAASTCLKYGNWNDSEKASFLVRQGLAWAKEKANIDKAKTKFKQAYKLDSASVNLEDLEAEAKQLAAISSKKTR